MKKKLKAIQIAIAVCVLLIFAPVGMLVGCKSPNATSYKVVGSVQVTADVAMRAWGSWVSSHNVPVETELKVKKAYDIYRASAILAANAGKALAQAETETNRSRLDIALAAASASLQDLVALIRSLGVNVK